MSDKLGSSGAVLVEHEGAVATLTLNRPERRNAFDPPMIEALTSAVLQAGRNADVRVVVLAGAGPAFCAGADIAFLRQTQDRDHAGSVAEAHRLADLLTAVRDCPKPVVCRTHGAAFGGGLGLVAATDIPVAADNARFAFSEVRLGIVPAVITPFVLPRIGVTAARELYLTGEPFDAHRALSIGLVSRVVAPDELDVAVDEMVDALCKGSPGAQSAAKRLVPFVFEHGSAAREEMAEIFAERRTSAEGREGLTAFLEKRSPAWSRRPENVPDAGEGGKDRQSDVADRNRGDHRREDGS